MDQDKHRAAMSALSDLIRSQLESEDRGRFASVQRLAVIGQKLMIEMNPRPEDIRLGGNRHRHNIYQDDHDDLILGPPMIGIENDQQQTVREVLAMMGPAFGGLRDQSNAGRRQTMARELNELLEARGVARERARKNLGARPD